jgi:Ca-activated chloride channel family protein
MSLQWPGFLLLLGLIPLLIVAYVWTLRRRRKFAVRYSSLSLVKAAMPGNSWLRRHLPFGLFLLAISSLVLALTRPTGTVSIPVGQTTVILAMDVSRSMCSTDIPPNRLKSAEDAAITFIRSQKSYTHIGIVAFSGFSELVQPPTNDKQILSTAINNLYTGRRTAIGSGILSSLDAISEVDESVAPSSSNPTEESQITPVPKGEYIPHIIVLLTDGASNTGVLPLVAAQQAANRGVRIYTIGFGTANGGPFMFCGSDFNSGDFFGNGGFGFGGGFRRGIDEQTLQDIAGLTGGQYYSAESANELQKVFQDIPITFVTRKDTIEVSVFFAAIGGLLALIAIVLSQIWHPLP